MKITKKIAAIGLALLLLVCGASAFADEFGNNAPNGGAINYPTNPVDNNYINNNGVPNGGAIYHFQE